MLWEWRRRMGGLVRQGVEVLTLGGGVYLA